MSMYQMVFADGESGLPILGLLGFKNISDVGRYRSAWLEKDEKGNPRIAVYTRNGLGNRECCHADDPEYGNKLCKHHIITKQEEEYLELPPEEIKKNGYKPLNIFIDGQLQGCNTGKIIDKEYYVCENPYSIDCHCVGCIITYHLPKHPNYLFDRDDSFDGTYCTIYFSVPDNLKNILNEVDPRWVENISCEVNMSNEWMKRIEMLKNK